MCTPACEAVLPTVAVIVLSVAWVWDIGQVAPSGPVTVIASPSGRLTASLNTSSICWGGASSAAPDAGLLLLSSAWACAGTAVAIAASSASTSTLK